MIAAATAERTDGRFVEQLMGLPVSLALRGRHARDDIARAAWAEVVGELRWVDRVFSTYRPDSVINRLGRGEIGLADCPPEVAEVLELGEAARRDSDGAFSVWRRGADGHSALDPSAVVKGWAVHRAARRLRALPGTDSCLSAGGDMACHVSGPASPPWRIGVEDPADPRRILAVIPVRSGAVATSGTAHRGAHIVDARTGEPPAGIAAVTVVAPTLTEADIDATAAFALGPGAPAWLRRRPGRNGLVVFTDGRREIVQGAGACPGAGELPR